MFRFKRTTRLNKERERGRKKVKGKKKKERIQESSKKKNELSFYRVHTVNSEYLRSPFGTLKLPPLILKKHTLFIFRPRNEMNIFL